MTARAQAFAASARDLRPVVLLTVGDNDGVTGYVLTASDPRVDKAVLNLAQAVAATAEPAQAVPDLTRTRVVGVPRVNRRAAPGRDTQTGADPAETARRVEMALRTFGANTEDPPTWVAAVVRWHGTANAAGCWPVRGAAGRAHPGAPRWRNGHGGGLAAGRRSGRGEVRQLLAQVAAALPGFDVGVRVRIITPWPSAIAGAGAAVLLAVAAVWVGRVVPDGARPADLPPALLAVLLVAVAAASRCSRCAAGASGPGCDAGSSQSPTRSRPATTASPGGG